MKKFQYKIENFKTFGMVNIILTKKDEEKMNALGEEGWELVGINDTKNGRNVMAIFKREKSE